MKVETNKNYHFSNRVTSSNTSHGSSIPVHFSCPSSRISFFNAAHGEDISQLHRPSGLSTRFFSFFCQPPWRDGQCPNEQRSRSSIPSILSRSVLPSFSIVPLAASRIFFVSRRAFRRREPKSSPPPARGRTRNSISREINVCLSWLIRADPVQRYYWPGRDTLEKYAVWILIRTVFTVVLGRCDTVMQKPRKPESDVDWNLYRLTIYTSDHARERDSRRWSPAMQNCINAYRLVFSSVAFDDVPWPPCLRLFTYPFYANLPVFSSFFQHVYLSLCSVFDEFWGFVAYMANRILVYSKK